MTSNPTIQNERAFASFPITDPKFIKQQMLTWASPFNICCFLDSQEYPGQPISPAAFECLLAVNAVDTFSATAVRAIAKEPGKTTDSGQATEESGQVFEESGKTAEPEESGQAIATFATWARTHQDWLFGHFGYDLAAETEPPSESADPHQKPDPIGFPDLFFFVPETVIRLQNDNVQISTFHPDPASIWQEISATTPPEPARLPQVTFTPLITQEEYLTTIETLKRHILRGDCYEINFCQEFIARPAPLDPYAVWQALAKASPNPFAAFYRLDTCYLFCASPERYLKKTGSSLLSQPIKGTAPRLHNDPEGDHRIAFALHQSPKDRAENVMVVDLVRNDLSRICLPGSVKVPELYGVYPFPQVHQMISSVTGELQPGLHWTDAIRATFPMGSMTGAPKNRVVQLIRRYERSRRGIYSGAIGYVTPSGDFDFNVVIRSLMYQPQTAYLSYHVGSGITWYSDPAAEYQECLVKAEGIRKALQPTGNT